MARILKEQLQVDTYLIIKNPGYWGVAENVAQIKHIDPGSGAFGVQIPGYRGGSYLSGALDANHATEGMYFTIYDINDHFELAPAGMVPAKAKVDFDSVILAEHKKEQIIHAMKQIDFAELIFTTWGFSKTFEKGKGISMLFYGPPGTGKTLMAQAIAHKLDYTLKVISNADLQSSVPGEAERNIRKHFKDSKDGKSVLLFDECDSLIYSRSAVGAILGAQINELLSQLERFEGITVFTTNRLGTLDEAVNRRLSIKVEFAMPSLEERVKIWKRMFPAEAPLDKDIDWRKLAKFEVAGGHIKNAVLRAAREAAVADLSDKDKKITMEHLRKGLEAEVKATKEFEDAKKQWEGRYKPVDRMMHDGGKLKRKMQKENSLSNFKKQVAEMKDG